MTENKRDRLDSVISELNSFVIGFQVALTVPICSSGHIHY